MKRKERADITQCLEEEEVPFHPQAAPDHASHNSRQAALLLTAFSGVSFKQYFGHF
jgi:hypothetical protein